MELGMKSEDGTAKKTVDDFPAPGNDAEGLRVRPWNMPEHDHGGSRQSFPDHARQQRKVIVLNEDDRIFAGCFFHDSVCEALLTARYCSHPVRERPAARRRHGKAAIDLRWQSRSSSRPAPPRRSRRAATYRSDCRAAPAGDRANRPSRGRPNRCVRYPRAPAGSHDRFERRHEAAGWNLKLDASFRSIMDIGLAIRDDLNLRARQFFDEQLMQSLRRPNDVKPCVNFRSTRNSASKAVTSLLTKKGPGSDG